MNWMTAKQTLIIGHRGASAYAPENTLAAFELAAEQGADGVELDVQLSADGRVMVFHDFDVSRLTNGEGLVTQMTAADLQSLTMAEGQTIPTLGEVFEVMGPRLLYNIEVKYFGWRGHGLEAAVADCIESHHMENKVLISSFNPLAVRRARRHMPRTVPIAILYREGMFEYSRFLAKSNVVHPAHTMVDDAYMAWARKRGYRVNVWTVDDPAEARRLVDLGVNGLITNKPDVIRGCLP